MEHDSKIAGKIKAQITRFSNRLTDGLTKPERRFIREIIYGIQASKDVKLSNIARSLGETIPLIKTEWRLSRNAAKSDFTDLINERLIELGKNRVADDTVSALDPGDIGKPYAKKMEYLALVRDGSAKETKSSGYWTMEVVGADVEGEELSRCTVNSVPKKRKDSAARTLRSSKPSTLSLPTSKSAGSGRLIGAVFVRMFV